jgi:2-amino-4-hydroxy-6-hydroxymethyldihydropteridine diphosphokinase
MAKVAYLALGSNQGNRIQFIQDALRRIGETPGIETLACSEIEETEPVGKTDQAFFLNCIAAIKTSLTPHELLAVCHKVEGAGGRLRTEKWGPRTIDVDIVEMENVLVDEDDLVLPHPELVNRQFWIRELAEVKSGVKSE